MERQNSSILLQAGMKLKQLPHFLFVALLAAILFIPFLGRAHLFDWDEINFAESAREMVVTGNYSRVMIDYQPFFQKPPLFFWLQAGSMQIFGINEFAARFPNAVCGIITLCLIFFLGRKYFDETFGWLWVMAYAGSFLPHLYFKSGIIDPWFNLFIFSSLVFLIKAFESKFSFQSPVVLSGIFIGLGFLTKGPVAILILGLTVVFYLVYKGWKWFSANGSLAKFIYYFFSPPASEDVDVGAIYKKAIKAIILFLFASFFVMMVWLGVEVSENGFLFLKEFYLYQLRLFRTEDAGHGGPFYYHIAVLLIGCFPASIIAITGFFRKHDANEKQLNFRKWMVILFTVVLVIFSIVKTKIIHYSSLCYLPLAFLAAWEMYYVIKSKAQFSWIQRASLLLLGAAVGIAATVAPYLGSRPEILIPYIKDPFAIANLGAEVDWPPSLMLFGFAYLILVIISVLWMGGQHKKGFILLFAGSCILLQILMFAFVPRIERYTQGAAIDFYKSLQGKDVYVEVLGFKSYAHLFYTQKMPSPNHERMDKYRLLSGDTDKPVYFVCKITKAGEYKALPQLEEIAGKNGFVFLKVKMPPPEDTIPRIPAPEP